MPDLEDRVAALEAIVAGLAWQPEPEPDFMSEVDTRATWSKSAGVSLRITHVPSGIAVEAPTRPEAIAKLGRALERRAERRANLDARAAGGIPGAA